jgi:hypothetical protein
LWSMQQPVHATGLLSRWRMHVRREPASARWSIQTIAGRAGTYARWARCASMAHASESSVVAAVLALAVALALSHSRSSSHSRSRCRGRGRPRARDSMIPSLYGAV